MNDDVSLEQFVQWLDEEHKRDLWFEIDGPASGQLAGHIRALMARIALLEADAEELADAANKVAELEDNMREAMNHAVKYWKENGMKTDDQLGIVALVLAAGLGLTKKVGG